MGLTIGGRCETPGGPGKVVSVRNARWREPAWVLVELDGGQRSYFAGGQVTESAPGRGPLPDGGDVRDGEDSAAGDDQRHDGG